MIFRQTRRTREVTLLIENGSNLREKARLTNEDSMKYEIAEELGLMDKVLESGWKSLTSKESGRIGGIIAKRKKEAKNKTELT
jgi:hypothetical protein